MGVEGFEVSLLGPQRFLAGFRGLDVQDFASVFSFTLNPETQNPRPRAIDLGNSLSKGEAMLLRDVRVEGKQGFSARRKEGGRLYLYCMSARLDKGVGLGLGP